MKWFVAICCVAIALAIHLGILWVRPDLLRLYPSDPAYTILFRAGRTLAVAAPALFLFVASAVARKGDHGRTVAGFASLFLLGLIAWSAREEYHRLAPYADRYSFRQLLPHVDLLLLCACAFAFFVAFVAPLIALVRQNRTARGNLKPVRSRHAAFGDAQWARMDQAQEVFPADGMMPLGERYRVDRDDTAPAVFNPADAATWGLGGRRPVLAFNCDFGSTHGLVFAGSGGFKTTGFVVPILLRWPHNAVVLDPSLEVHPMVATYRENMKSGMKRTIVRIDPDVPNSGFNVLDWIGSGKSKGSPEEDIAAVTSWMTTGQVTRQDPNSFFRNSAQQLLRGLLAYICLNTVYEGPRTLRALRVMISDDEKRFRTRLGEMMQNMNDGSFAKLALGPFVSMTEATFSGIYSTASEMTDWLSYERYAGLVSGGKFQSAQLAQDEVDVFVCLDIKTLDNHSGLARVIFGALLNALYNADGAVTNRVAFLMDEAARLGHMKIIETARDAGRKYGITMVMIYQSLGQLRDQWGGKDALSSWLESTSWQSFSAISDVDTAKWLSDRCGSFTMDVTSFSQQARSGGGKGGGFSVSASTSLQKRPLIFPDDIMSSMRRDEQLLFVAGIAPIRCGRPIYFRRPEMLELCGTNRFAKGKVTATNSDREAAQVTGKPVDPAREAAKEPTTNSTAG